MSIGFIIIKLLLLGSIFLFKQQGKVVKYIKWIYLFGILASLGGCFGALAWLGAETSGNSNLFHEINPYIWSAILVTGLCIMFVATVIGIAYRDVNNETDKREN
ncbi:MAG: hypothetical protein AAF410_01065 [Pseudomonadota bacterium]